MFKTTFRVPLADNIGVKFAPNDWVWLYDQLVSRYGGYTIEGQASGGWLHGDDLYEEPSYTITVVTGFSGVWSLKRFVADDVKVRFRQLAMYHEVQWGTWVSLI